MDIGKGNFMPCLLIVREHCVKDLVFAINDIDGQLRKHINQSKGVLVPNCHEIVWCKLVGNKFHKINNTGKWFGDMSIEQQAVLI